MAILSPTIQNIQRLRIKPMQGELVLLNFLMKNLDDTYEIYFQPFLNGDNPDIVVMRKDSGVLIFEVKDWELNNYYIDENAKWRLKKDQQLIKSPLAQVENYKSNLFNLHIEELFNKNILNKKNWATVNCAVFFNNASEQELKDFFTTSINLKLNTKHKNFLHYVELIGKDSLTALKLNSILDKFWLKKKSYYFDESLYESFKRYLQPPFHQLEEGIHITYTPKQKELIRSESRPRRKIKGVAGCGKTLVLAKRAVNAHIRTEKRVLILTYNLSLKNYIHDRISEVRENFLWSNFYITNYHTFFKIEANNYNLEIQNLESWQDVHFFEPVKDKIVKFDVVLIDEIQDYCQEWIDIIVNYFIHEETEFVVFGDEKQNIYERELDENNEPIVRTIRADWNRSLNDSHRFGRIVGDIAIKFKETFLKKYLSDEVNFTYQPQIDYDKTIIKYYNFSSYNQNLLLDTIFDLITKNQIHPSNVCILCSKIDLLRDLDFLIRTKKHERTSTTFETQEEYETIRNDVESKTNNNNEQRNNINEEIEERIEEIRRIRKNHFWMKSGTMKLSTVHSFKGWEIDTLFLLIENDKDANLYSNAELIYTGLTRTRKNLVIINLGNMIYDNFFKKVIES